MITHLLSMTAIISTIIHCISSFLWCCSQPVYFIQYTFETNYELISAVFAAIYTCLVYSTKVCYLLIYGLASMVEYILFTLIETIDPFMMAFNSIIFLAKIIIHVPVYIIQALLYVPLLVTSLSEGIVELVTLITYCYDVFLNSTRGLLKTTMVIFDCLKTEGTVWYEFLETTSTLFLTYVQTLVGALIQLNFSLFNVISNILASIKGAIFDCVDALQKLEYFENSAIIIANYVNKVYVQLHNEILIAFGSFVEIFFTFLELVSYIVIFTAVFILLGTVFMKIYLMYSNAMNSANSLMSIFRSSLLFGIRRDTQHIPEPLVRTERFAQEGNVLDAERDDSLMNNVRNRVLRRPQPRHHEEPGLHPSQPSRVNTQTHDEEHRPSASGEHSRTHTTQPSHLSRKNLQGMKTDAAKLVQQLEEERDRLLCVVCQDNPKNMLILPCKHLCVCQDCVDEITSNGSKKCPLCRGRISSYLEVYA